MLTVVDMSLLDVVTMVDTPTLVEGETGFESCVDGVCVRVVGVLLVRASGVTTGAVVSLLVPLMVEAKDGGAAQLSGAQCCDRYSVKYWCPQWSPHVFAHRCITSGFKQPFFEPP